jgi:hypothetical protein
VTSPRIELAPGTENNAFAGMLAQLLRQNLDDHPEKAQTFLRLSGRVAIVVTDLGLTVTLAFDKGALTVHDAIRGIPDAMIRTTAEWVTRMSLVELNRYGLPDPRGEGTKAVADATKRGEITTHVALSAIPLMLRLTNVMSVV